MLESFSKFLPSSILRLINQRSGFRNIIINAGWLFADQGLTMVVGFLVGAWVARYLGPAQYGIYNYALAIVALFSPLVALGLKDIVIRDIVRKPEDKDKLLGAAFGLKFAGSLLALGLAIGIGQITQPDDALTRFLIAIMAGQFVFAALNETLDYWFQSQVQAKYTVWAKNIGALLIAVVKIGLILYKAPLIAFAWAALCQVVIFTIMLAVFHRTSQQRLTTWRLNFFHARSLLANSWPLILSDLAIMIYMRIGQVMLGNMADKETLGLYSAATRLSELWYFIPMAISSSVFPAIIRSRETQSQKNYHRRMQVFYDAMSLTAYAIVIPLVLLGPTLVNILFGAEYAQAGLVLRVHAWSFLFVSLGVARSRWLIGENMIRFDMFATILGAVVNIVMNYFLIPRYGGMGTAWAALISYAVSGFLSGALAIGVWPALKQQSLSLMVPFRLPSFLRSVQELLNRREGE